MELSNNANLWLKGIIDSLRDSRNILTDVYKKKMNVLGHWSYEVLDVRSTSMAEMKKE